MAKILLAEDDLELSEKITAWLNAELQCLVEQVADGSEAADKLVYSKYDLIIIDWGLPTMSGVDVCKQFRANGGNTPVLMLTGRAQMENKLEGLDAGADDYVTKPFDIRELSARVRGLLRRSNSYAGKVLSLGCLTLDTGTFKVTMNEKSIELQPKEFMLLEFLTRNAEQPFTAEALLQRVWDSDTEVNTEIIYTYMTKLRKKLTTADGRCPIKTIRGLGYKIEAV